MPSDQTENTGLGSFEVLPPEIRGQIWSLLIRKGDLAICQASSSLERDISEYVYWRREPHLIIDPESRWLRVKGLRKKQRRSCTSPNFPWHRFARLHIDIKAYPIDGGTEKKHFRRLFTARHCARHVVDILSGHARLPDLRINVLEDAEHSRSDHSVSLPKLHVSTPLLSPDREPLSDLDLVLAVLRPLRGARSCTLNLPSSDPIFISERSQSDSPRQAPIEPHCTVPPAFQAPHTTPNDPRLALIEILLDLSLDSHISLGASLLRLERYNYWQTYKRHMWAMIKSCKLLSVEQYVMALAAMETRERAYRTLFPQGKVKKRQKAVVRACEGFVWNEESWPVKVALDELGEDGSDGNEVEVEEGLWVVPGDDHGLEAGSGYGEDEKRVAEESMQGIEGAKRRKENWRQRMADPECLSYLAFW
ncbi:MAG: hypothetical protein MMC23_002425 [Stictis urceolatum]|nr:hypothetical protein [Stictis urceolata]